MGILNTVGQVTSFRLMTDSNTGKPRGYGFATYSDADQAASAVRNLNDYEVGGRKIRVDWPHQQTKDDKIADGDVPAPETVVNGQAAQTALPPLPPGVDLPPNLKVTDAISQTLSSLPPQTLLDILTQMKSLAISEPAKTQELLRAQPQLSYAIFQALLLMGLVDEKIFAQVIAQPQQVATTLPQVMPPQMAQPQIAQPPMIPQHQTPVPGYPPQPPQHQQYSGFPPPPVPGQAMPVMPPRPGMPYGAPPPQFAQQPTPQPQQPAQPTQDQLLQQILSMDQRTIDALAPMEKAQVLQIRAQMGVR